MPLIKSPSKKAFKKNVETEMKANPGKRAQNLAIAYSVARRAKKGMLKSENMYSGGELKDMDDDQGSIAEMIMHRRKMMAEGGEVDDGMVDLEKNAEETPSDPSPYDKQNEMAAGKETYDDSQLDEVPMDSGDMGDEHEMSEEDMHDMISSIRKKMRAKRGY